MFNKKKKSSHLTVIELYFYFVPIILFMIVFYMDKMII